MYEVFTSLSDWISTNIVSLIATVVILLSYLILTQAAIPRVKSIIISNGFNDKSILRVGRWIRMLAGLIAMILLLFFWGFDFSSLLIFSTSILALAGVALFANWSVLSNITAFFILLFHKPFRQGSYIRVIDVDNYIEGLIVEVNLFATSLKTSDQDIVIYPNNLLVSRPVFVSPNNRIGGFGKLTDFKPATRTEES